jgi:nitrogen fixation protein NifU and related proteins
VDLTGAEDIYQATIMDRARRPRHQRRLEVFDAEAREINPLCGDRVTIRLRCDDAGRITELGYEARACAICVAATDLMAEIAPGMNAVEARETAGAFEAAIRGGEPIGEASRLGALRPFQALHDTPSRIGCATLGWRSLSAAFRAREA